MKSLLLSALLMFCWLPCTLIIKLFSEVVQYIDMACEVYKVLRLLRKTPSAASVPWALWTLTCALWSSTWGACVKDRCLHRAKKRKFLCIFRGAWTHLRVQVCSWETIPSRTVLGTHLEQWFVFSLDLSYEGWPGCPRWAARSLGKALRSPGNFFRNQG